MKSILLLVMLFLVITAHAQQKQSKKEPPKIIMVKPAPKSEVKSKTSAHPKYKPAPKIVAVKKEAPQRIDSVRNKQ